MNLGEVKEVRRDAAYEEAKKAEAVKIVRCLCKSFLLAALGDAVLIHDALNRVRGAKVLIIVEIAAAIGTTRSRVTVQRPHAREHYLCHADA